MPLVDPRAHSFSVPAWLDLGQAQGKSALTEWREASLSGKIASVVALAALAGYAVLLLAPGFVGIHTLVD